MQALASDSTFVLRKYDFQEVPVPSNWELLGYEFPMYCNVRYPFTLFLLGADIGLF